LTTLEPSAKPAGSGARIVVRDVLALAWPLFQVCLPTCLPLAVMAVAVSGIPVAGALPQSAQWWGVVAARTVLVLICYGAMLRQQSRFAAGERPQLLQSLRDGVRDVPSVLVLVAVWTLPFLPAAASTASRGFDLMALLLTAAAAAVLVFVLPAWPAMIAANISPWAALAHSVRLVRGRWLQLASLMLVLLAGVLVFTLLAGILLGMVMNLAGQGVNPTAGALAASRWLMAIALAAPVVYAGALSVETARSLAGARQ
jgi:hypothetical protein